MLMLAAFVVLCVRSCLCQWESEYVSLLQIIGDLRHRALQGTESSLAPPSETAMNNLGSRALVWNYNESDDWISACFLSFCGIPEAITPNMDAWASSCFSKLHSGKSACDCNGAPPKKEAVQRLLNFTSNIPNAWSTYPSVLKRASFIESQLEKVGKVDQVVILGAGFDTRPYLRSSMLSTASRIFETDVSSTQELKHAMVEACHIHHVHGAEKIIHLPLNLQDVDPFEMLRTHPQFSLDAHTVFIAEDVAEYMSLGENLKWLAALRKLTDNQTLIFTTLRADPWYNVSSRLGRFLQNAVSHLSSLLGRHLSSMLGGHPSAESLDSKWDETRLDVKLNAFETWHCQMPSSDERLEQLLSDQGWEKVHFHHEKDTIPDQAGQRLFFGVIRPKKLT